MEFLSNVIKCYISTEQTDHLLVQNCLYGFGICVNRKKDFLFPKSAALKAKLFNGGGDSISVFIRKTKKFPCDGSF